MVEPETYPGTNTYVNNFDIKESKTLDQYEQLFCAWRTIHLKLHPDRIGIFHVEIEFDLAHLKAIHRYLFQDTYKWAGQIRSYSMSKSGDIFSHPETIERDIAYIAHKIKSDSFLVGKDRGFLCNRVANYYGLINQVHPFPEGNGRTQRMFLTQLVQKSGYDLDWEIVPKWENVVTQQNAHREQDFSSLERLVDRILILNPATSIATL